MITSAPFEASSARLLLKRGFSAPYVADTRLQVPYGGARPQRQCAQMLNQTLTKIADGNNA